MSVWCIFQPPQLIPKPHKKKEHGNSMHVFEREFSKHLKLCTQVYLEEYLAFKFEDSPRFLLFSIVNCFVIFYQDKTCPFHLLTFLSYERKRHKNGCPVLNLQAYNHHSLSCEENEMPLLFPIPTFFLYWGCCHFSLYPILEDLGPGSTCTSSKISFHSVMYIYY